MDTIWDLTYEIKAYPALEEDLTCDAAVIGGGLCGILTAYRLKCAGLRTVLLEAGRIGGGQSSATTAKITLCHGEILRHLTTTYGVEAARLYAATETESIEEYARIVREEKLECDFKRLPGYLYALYGERHINAEYDAAQSAGIECRKIKNTALPFEVASALEVQNQAQLHPLKLISRLAERLEIYENTRVTAVSGDRLICDGGVISARNIVLATNYPSGFELRALFPIRLHRRMAHVCTFTGVDSLDGMYMGIDGGYNYRSFGTELIVSGEAHVSGSGAVGTYERLKRRTMCTFRNAVPSRCWSAEDSVALDGVPYIGRIFDNVFVAAGFGTWGMSTSMTASRLICDMICGKDNRAEALYSPKRFNLSASEELGGMISRAASGIVSSRLRIPEDDAKSLPRDCGRIVRYNGRKAAVYRDEEGRLHVSEPYCPHMSCELVWNADDKTWDCPCHGSRFDMDGKMLTGPACRGI